MIICDDNGMEYLILDGEPFTGQVGSIDDGEGEIITQFICTGE